jgi:prevent-host-death family protein
LFVTHTNVWKLQDAKARFSELVRRARAGKPQQVTIHGRDAVLVVDPERFDIRAKRAPQPTLADFVERSKRYRGEPLKVPRIKSRLPSQYKSPFDEDAR